MSKEIIYIGNKLSIHGHNPSNIDTLGPQLESEGYKVIYASTKKNIVFRLLDMVFTIVFNHKNAGVVLIDTYSTNAFYYAWICSLTCQLFHIPYFPILHGGNLPYRISKNPNLAKQIFGKSECNIVISDYLKFTLEKLNFRNKVIYNNIGITKYKFLHRTTISPNLLWVRAFHNIYNPSMAIRVLKKLKKFYPEAKLTMVGPDKDGTMALCKKLGSELLLTNDILITGQMKKEEWIKLSENFGVFINTTNFDNLPVSIIEAKALGMPIVSTNVGGIPFIINNGIDGLLVNSNDEDKMVEFIIDLLEDPKLTANISLSARKAAESYDWEIIKHKWFLILAPFVEKKLVV